MRNYPGYAYRSVPGSGYQPRRNYFQRSYPHYRKQALGKQTKKYAL